MCESCMPPFAAFSLLITFALLPATSSAACHQCPGTSSLLRARAAPALAWRQDGNASRV